MTNLVSLAAHHANPCRVIGLTGHMGAGKDAAAALLSMLGYQRVAFADEVRHEVEAAMKSDRYPRRIPDWLYNDLESASDEEVWAKPTSERMRRILQWWGTEYRRAEYVDYWVWRGVDRARAEGLFVFSDVRFPNEVSAIRGMGGQIWRINRNVEVSGIAGHASEAMVDVIQPDLEIDNNGTLLELAERLKAALAHEA